ncbi:TonB-dependent receptor [Aquimarina sp. U1-2]|uniref:TonB-dependent receptor domain-containing protein n=1 Tax=Aquimarina sp. U1-2 TaxID=2823141 RepID=UPI001AED0107|nr:TonB-dependent receptor [Aquimarina sp. U1-2]MBP2832374.1 TonB-dependent receptor [Aquimarina sp. U1-2]
MQSIIVYSQQQITGIVLDSATNTPIKNASITSKGKNEIYTDITGTFTIMASDSLIIYKEGYEEKRILLHNTTQITVKLSQKITNLDEVLVNQLSIPNFYKNATASVSLISSEDINRGNPLELHPVLNRIPGIFMQNATLNTNRITIRGIGARNLFGTANIRAYFGDIPLTDGNGESSIEDLELGAVAGIEIQKGPSSSSYGVGLGGTILLKPQFKINAGTTAQLSMSTGSYGLRRLFAKTAIGNENKNLTILYSNNHTDGYRANNTYDRNTVTLTSNLNIDNNDRLAILGSYVDLKAGIPSSLNQEDFNTNPSQAAFTWGRSQAFENVNYGILGFTWEHDYSSMLKQVTSTFLSFRKNDEPRPFNILEENTETIGVRSRILGNHKIWQKEWNWSLGGELFFDTYAHKTFQNLYESFPPGTGSVRGDQLSDLFERRYYYNLFAESNFVPYKGVTLNVGLHLNQTFFDITDTFFEDGENNSGQFEFEPILSPKIGINAALTPKLILFGTIAHGFSTPTTAETLLPNGIFNPDIKPEIGWNYEVGTRYKLFRNIRGTLSAYTMKVSDLLVARRTTEDNFFAINAGKTTHNGFEAEINYSIINKKPYQVELWVNASIYDYKFDEFVDLDNNFSGNKLTGVPEEVFNLGIDITAVKGFYGNLTFQKVHEIPANDANTVFSDSYELLHGKIGYKNTIGKDFDFDIFFGANNILDTQYVAQLQINARGFGGNAPRYFYPGLPFNTYGGININYRL